MLSFSLLLPLHSNVRENEALFAMLAENEKLHVNNKKENENWSAQIVQGLKLELGSYDLVRVVDTFEYFYFSFREFMRLISFSLHTCIVFIGNFRNLLNVKDDFFSKWVLYASIFTLYDKYIVKQTVTRREKILSMPHQILKTHIKLTT